MTDLLKPAGWDQFPEAKDLLLYLERHNQTFEAKCLGTHVLMLYWLAGYSVVVFPGTKARPHPEGVDVAVFRHNLSSLMSLHLIIGVEELITKARLRLATTPGLDKTWRSSLLMRAMPS